MRILFLCFCFSFCCCSAYRRYMTNIPNSHRTPCPGGARDCHGSSICGAMGHTDCWIEDDINPFGDQYDDDDDDGDNVGGEQWTQARCRADSDGDGFTNGDELGDLCCLWNFGDFAATTTHLDVSHPGSANSVPSGGLRQSCLLSGTPRPPRNATVRVVSPDSVLVAFPPLDLATESCVCSYTVQLTRGPAPDVQVLQTLLHVPGNAVATSSSPSTLRICLLGGNNAVTTVFAHVRAQNLAGVGPWVSAAAPAEMTVTTTPTANAVLPPCASFVAPRAAGSVPAWQKRFVPLGAFAFLGAGLLLVVLFSSEHLCCRKRPQNRVRACLEFRAALSCWRVTRDWEIVWGEVLALFVWIGAAVSVYFFTYEDVRHTVYTYGAAALPARSLGGVAALLMSVVLLPVARHSMWRFLVGLSYDRALRMHVALGYLAVAATIVHGVWMTVAYAPTPLGVSYMFQWDGADFPIIPGTISGLVLIVVVIFTIPAIRRRNYSLFKVSHLLVFIAIVMACIHYTDMLFYLAIPAALYLIDVIVGLADMVVPAQLLDVTSLGAVMRLHIRKARFQCNAGQFVYLLVPSVSLLPHPFTIASMPEEDGSFHLCIKSMGKGRFVDNLVRRLQQNPDVRLFVMGPLGTTRMDPKSYTHVLLVAGGVGITPFSSEWVALARGGGRAAAAATTTKSAARVQEMISLGQQSAVACPRVRLVWSFRTTHIADLLLPVFSQTRWPPSFSAHFYETRGEENSAELPATLETEYRQLADSAGATLEWVRGQRPDLMHVVNAMKAEVVESGNRHLAILCCGPDPMVSGVRDVAYALSDPSCRIHVHTERFAF